jgi:CysZ protein
LLLLRSLLFTILLLLAAVLPVVGQSVVPVLVALVTGWFIALEVVAVPFYRRGMGLRKRTAMLRPRRMLAVGLGLPAALLCMIPLLAIVVMPAAFAGGVLVALDVLGLAHPEKHRASPFSSAAGLSVRCYVRRAWSLVSQPRLLRHD